jgi:hypothetical protein
MEKVTVKNSKLTFDQYWELAEEKLGLTGWKYGYLPEDGEEYKVIGREKHLKAGEWSIIKRDYFTTEDILVIEGRDGDQYLIPESATKSI